MKSDIEEVIEKDAEMKEPHTVEEEKKKVDNKQEDSKAEEQKEVNDPRQKSWQEAARESGVILISDEGHPGLVEEEADETVEVEVKETPIEKGKHKKPKVSRTEMKVMTEESF